MLRVEDRIAQFRLNQVFNIYHGNAPAYLNDHFVLNNNITRSATDKTVIIPKIKGKESSCFSTMQSKTGKHCLWMSRKLILNKNLRKP